MTEATQVRTEPSPLFKEHMLEGMRGFYPHVTSRTALAALHKARELHAGYPGQPPKEVTDAFKPVIDGAAADTMIHILNNGSPYRTDMVGSEGEKEKFYVGEAAPSAKGTHGTEGLPLMAAVSDVVEGTTPLSQLAPGASSVIAVAPVINGNCGIAPLPPDSHYMIKFAGPPQLQGVVDPTLPYRINLMNILDALGIPPGDLRQITMTPKKKGRECNQQYVDAAVQLGVPVEEINVGDFMPGVLAALDPSLYGGRPTILVGRGGYEEGIMAAAAAKAVGGVWIGQEYFKDKPPGKFITLDEAIPADPEQILVSTSFITPDKWFAQPGIEAVNGNHSVTTMVVTHKGVEFQTHSW